MRNINPFYVRKALDGVAGKMKNTSRLKNGKLIAEVQNNKYSEVWLKSILLGSYPVQVDKRR
jgi:hypothetical protein